MPFNAPSDDQLPINGGSARPSPEIYRAAFMHAAVGIAVTDSTLR